MLARGMLAVLPFVAALAAEAQPAGRMPRVGLLSPEPFPGERDAIFLKRLSELGWTEGRNLVLERRSAQNSLPRLPQLASELAALKVDVIVAITTPAVAAARDATRTIPIVMAPAGDALGSGFVTNLARPGGNVTGVTFTHETIGLKRLELLREVLPGLERVAILASAQNRLLHEPMWVSSESAARFLNVVARRYEVRGPQEIAQAIQAIAKDRAGPVVVLPGSDFASARARLAELALGARLPTLCDRMEYVEAGCLMSYGGSLTEIVRQAAGHLDRILKGARAGDLPVEQPYRFELIINARTAKALGVTIPPSMLIRADRVIE